MRRNAIAPFRLEAHGAGLAAQALLLIDGHGRLLASNRAAGALLGLAATAAVPEALAAELRALASGSGQPSITGPGGKPLAAVVQALDPAPGAAALRLVSFADAGGEPPPRPQPEPDSAPLLYQARLEPIIALGVKAFRARRRILLLGETGVGKTTLVSSMHRQVHGPSRPFVHVNCSSISETLFEAEMFGYERGAFTGALAGGKVGFVEAANGGTLFLDEVGELALHQQAKLLKFLEDGTIQPVGSVKPRAVDVYVVCATNRDLWQEVRERRFREDLYYRIAMIPVEVPALRQHREELPTLIDTLLANLNLRRARKLTLTRACRDALAAHDYPGNMRELLGVMARLDLLADDSAGVELLPPHMLGASAAPVAPAAAAPLKEQVRAFERQRIAEALRGARSKRQAAKALGIDIASLLRKLQDP